MLTLYGNIISTCVRRVLLAFLEIGLKEGEHFKLVSVNDISETKNPEWIANQPFGQMPYLIDDENDKVIYESRAIAKYAAVKFDSPLLPSTTKLSEYVEFEIGSSVETSNFDPYVKELFNELVFKKRRGLEPNQAKIDDAEETLKSKLQGYERILAKQDYIGGNTLTLVDLFHVPFVTDVLEAGALQSLVDGSFPNVAKWWKTISELENWKQLTLKKAELLALMQQRAQQVLR